MCAVLVLCVCLSSCRVLCLFVLHAIPPLQPYSYTHKEKPFDPPKTTNIQILPTNTTNTLSPTSPGLVLCPLADRYAEHILRSLPDAPFSKEEVDNKGRHFFKKDWFNLKDVEEQREKMQLLLKEWTKGCEEQLEQDRL